MFTEALDPPDFGRIGRPAQTVVKWITSREKLRSDPRTPLSIHTIPNILFAESESKTNLCRADIFSPKGSFSLENLTNVAAYPKNTLRSLAAPTRSVTLVGSRA